MRAWPRHPVIYEVNTWAWLNDLSRRHQRRVDLATVPEEEWDAIASQGFDAIWFMGVWERSPAGIDVSMRNEGLLGDFRRALSDFSPQDNVGSPYCVRRYVVDEHLGGPMGLATARRHLSQRGLRLILDFVPNHVAPDHPGSAVILSTSFRGALMMRATTRRPSSRWRARCSPAAGTHFSRRGRMYSNSTPFSPGSGKR